MSREIDLTKPLSDKDRAYLLARGREQQVFQNDAQFADDPEAVARGLYVPGTAVDRAEGVPATPSVVPLAAQGGGGTDPDADEGLDTSEDPKPERQAGDGLDAETEDNYESWSKSELEAEIDRRNAEYDDSYQLARTGSKKELAARLREDDNTPDAE